MSGAGGWQSLKEAFTELVSLPPSERAARLAVLSESDPTLGARLEELLLADADADDRLSPFDLLSSPSTTSEPQPADPFGLAGRTVSHFRILDVLGAGGMGVVYRAHDARLDRTVALKFLLPQYALDPAAKERFLREARAVSALDHPNVCTVHEAGESEDGQAFFAMACYAGETLRDRLARTDSLPLEEALDIARQTLLGLAAAHEAGIVHRDLKPGNLMLVRDGTVKVLDFGLAKVADTDHSTPGARAGTAAYMSPEQVAGGPVDHRSDLWSLGVVLHEMLTARPPFGRGQDAAAMWAILNEAPAPPSSLRADVPARVDRIVDGLLEKSADERYSRAGDVLGDLDEAMPSGLARPRARRRPRVAAALIAVIAAASALFLTRERRAAASDEASIAVLPFLDLSNEQQQYFSDGVTEEILNALARIHGLHVPARTSSFHFRNRDLPVREIAEQLGVAHVLEGSVRRDGDGVRITATLVDARTERRLWSETLETDDGDVFDAQQRIADAVADALELRLAPGAVARMASRNPAAHDLYLQGLFHWNRRSPRDMASAIRLLEQAVTLDSAYARSWAGLALVYAASHATLPPLMPPDESLHRTEAAARRALALDSSLADAHSALGYAYHWHWRWDDAERELERALALEPRSARALHWYGEHLGKMGRGPEAVALTRRAISLDPFSLVLQSDLGLALSRDGRVEEAIAQYERARERDPGIVMPHIMLHRLYLVQGDVEASAAAGRRWAELTGAADADELGTLARAKLDPGLRPAASAILDRWAKGPASLLPDIALYSTQLGDHPRALDALERAHAARNPFLANLRTAQWYDPLRGEPRFERLIEAMKYPPLRARQPERQPQ